MPEEKIAGIIRELTKVTEAGDLEKTIAFFAEDAVLTDPYSTYKGKDAIKAHMGGMYNNLKNMKYVETGNRIIVQGSKAFSEYVISGTFQGQKWEILSMAAYEFSGDKVISMRESYDRMLIAKQVAPWPASIMVNMMIKQSEKATK